jgi:hypothetical protein
MYLGGASVTAANGFVLPSNSSFQAKLGPSLSIYGIARSGKSNDIRVLELA